MMRIETYFGAALFALLALVVVLGIGSIARPAAAAGSGSAFTVAGRSIPPNCLIDPWTKKLVCSNWTRRNGIVG